jgi:hypothetical protein
VTSEPRDPIEFARALTQQFSALSADLQLYSYVQGIFLLGSFYKERPEDYRRFASDDYWRDVRQKPNGRNVMRSLLAFTMRTKERGREALQNRVYKYARVLEYFHQNEVISDEIPQRLKDGGGIDAIYATLCRDARLPEELGDGSEETLAELPLARAGEGTTGTRAVAIQGSLAAGEIDGEGCVSYDEGQHKSVLLATASKDPTDTLSGDVKAAGTSQRGQLHGAPRKVILQVEMFEFELEEVLHAKRATICANVEPPNNRGWRPVLAQLVFTSNRTDGPWPGRSTINRDEEE